MKHKEDLKKAISEILKAAAGGTDQQYVNDDGSIRWSWVKWRINEAIDMFDTRDTERLNFLLQYFKIADIGDDQFQMGVSIDSEQLEYDLSFGKYDPSIPGNPPLFDDWTDGVDVRGAIDEAIEVHKKSIKGGNQC